MKVAFQKKHLLRFSNTLSLSNAELWSVKSYLPCRHDCPSFSKHTSHTYLFWSLPARSHPFHPFPPRTLQAFFLLTSIHCSLPSAPLFCSFHENVTVLFPLLGSWLNIYHLSGTTLPQWGTWSKNGRKTLTWKMWTWFSIMFLENN